MNYDIATQAKSNPRVMRPFQKALLEKQGLE